MPRNRWSIWWPQSSGWWRCGSPRDLRTRTTTLGHHKAEYFSSALEGLLILVAAGTIIYASVQRLLAPAPLESLGLGLLISLAASVVNGGVATAMMRVAKREDSIVLEADAHHLLTDVWTSVGILAGLAVVFFVPGAVWLDPVIAIAVALNIARVAYVLLRRSIDGLMDAALPVGEQKQIRRAVAAVLPPGARAVRLRTTKAGSVRFITFDLLLPGEMTVAASHAVCDRRGGGPGGDPLALPGDHPRGAPAAGLRLHPRSQGLGARHFEAPPTRRPSDPST